MQKVFVEHIVNYHKAERKNREFVYIALCITDASGAIYKGFGPGHAKLSPALFFPESTKELPELNEFVGLGNDGYLGLVIQPGKTDVWRKGVYLLGFQLANATHQCAGMAKLVF